MNVKVAIAITKQRRTNLKKLRKLQLTTLYHIQVKFCKFMLNFDKSYELQCSRRIFIKLHPRNILENA